MRHIFIINPAAGKKDSTLNIAGAIKKAAVKEKIKYEIYKTEYPKHATEIVKKLCKKYPDDVLRFYACGGDGTLNEVAAGAAAFENAEITHYPCGTGNDFIKLFGNELNDFYDISKLINGYAVPIDYIETKNGVSINIASIGLDARIAEGMQKYKRLFHIDGEVPYWISTAENIIKPITRNLQVTIDGTGHTGRYTLVVIANGRYYGGGFCPVPNADPTDGILDVLLIKAVSRLTIAKVIDAYKRGKYRDYPQYIEYFCAKNVAIKPNDKYFMDVNLDGEVFKASEAEIKVSQRKIVFVAPKNLSIK